MITKKYNNEEEWLDARRGLITGSKLGKMFSKRDQKPLSGYYELIAERIALPASEENAMYRGKRLEESAIDRFVQLTGKEVNTDLVMWHRDDDQNIALSPDGFIGEIEAVEVKCLNSAKHIEAWLTGEIPSEYEFQVLQYFIVNEKLEKLYFVFYDPRIPKDIFWHEVIRSSVQSKVETYLELERKTLEEIKKIEEQLTF